MKNSIVGLIVGMSLVFSLSAGADEFPLLQKPVCRQGLRQKEGLLRTGNVNGLFTCRN